MTRSCRWEVGNCRALRQTMDVERRLLSMRKRRRARGAMVGFPTGTASPGCGRNYYFVDRLKMRCPQGGTFLARGEAHVRPIKAF